MVVIFSATDTESEPALFDPWSAVHAASGGAAAITAWLLIPDRPWTGFIVHSALHLLYEGKDLLTTYGGIGIPKSASDPNYNTWMNSVADQVSTSAGYGLTFLLLRCLTRGHRDLPRTYGSIMLFVTIVTVAISVAAWS